VADRPNEIKKLQAWAWPLSIAGVLLLAFAIPNSDHPFQALAISVLIAIMSGVAFAFPNGERPDIAERPALRRLIIALTIFAIAIFTPMFIAALKPVLSRGASLHDPSAAWLEGIKFGGLICAFALGMRCACTDDNARKLLDGLLYMGGIWAFISIILFIADPAGIYGAEKFGAGRLTGAFNSPNSAGTLFGAMVLMSLGRIINRLATRQEPQILERIDPIMACVFAASMSALMLTVSRGAIVSTLVCVPCLCVALLYKRVSLTWLLVVVGGISVVSAIIFAVPMSGLIGRLGTLNDDAVVRATIFKSHFSFAWQHRWFGAGLGAFNSVNNSIVRPENYQALSVIRAMHNVYLQWFEEVGLVGLAALALLNAAILFPMVVAALTRKQMGGRIWAILGGYLVYLLHGFTDYAFQEPALSLFAALLLGCGFAMATNKTEKPLGSRPSAFA
jgi:O-antigen ligase